MKVWKLWAGASLLGAGAMAIACSSSSSGGSPTPGDDAGEGGTTDDGGGDGGMPCTAMAASGATIDAGAGWGCLEAVCNTELTACGSDCQCNNAILDGLGCVAEAGALSPTAQATKLTSCLTATITPIATDPMVTPLITCLQGKGKTMCAPSDGGTSSEGGSTDGGDGGSSTTDGGDGGGSTNDGGGSDGGASDAAGD